MLISDPHRLDGVKILGVDEHAWRHTRRGDKYVTVIIDLTPVRDGSGPARLLDMIEGRSKQVFKTWHEQQTSSFRDGIEEIAFDGFTGFKTAAAEAVPDAVAVMDPFHVVALAGGALDHCRQRVQQETRGHRGRTGDPLRHPPGVAHRRGSAHRPPTSTHPGRVRRSPSCRSRSDLGDLPAHRRRPQQPRPRRGEDRTAQGHRDDQREGAGRTHRGDHLGRTLRKRAGDVLAYFDRPGTSNGPTEAINGRLEHLRGSALGFRNLTNDIARSLLETGGFRPRLHPQLG